MNLSHLPHPDVLGAPIGGYLYCNGSFAIKHVEILNYVAAIDPQVAFNLLHTCRVVHLNRLLHLVAWLLHLRRFSACAPFVLTISIAEVVGI